ncbi:ABC transporter permease [Lachnospiraceae bacterium ZAX-1]
MNRKQIDILGILRNNVAWVLLIVFSIIFACISPNFFSITNIINILNQSSYTIITALGISFVMMAGEMDLSVGYAISLNGVISAILLTQVGLPSVVVVIISLALGVLLSVANMLIAHKLKLQLLMATIGTMTIFQGISYVLSQSKTISGFPVGFKAIGQGFVGPIPIPVLIMFILFLIVSFILNRTYIGRYVFAMGGNIEATRLAGINVFGMKMFIATIAGLMTGLAAIILCARLGSIQANSGAGMEFTILTAVLLAGVSVRGGEGKISCVVAGVLILSILANGMQLAGLNVYYQFIAKGAIMLGAIGFDVYQFNRKTAVVKRDSSKKGVVG